MLDFIQYCLTQPIVVTLTLVGVAMIVEGIYQLNKG